MKAKRDSNIELLRIIAMLLIVCYHIFDYAIKVQLKSPTSIEFFNNGWFCEPVFSSKILWITLIAPFGKVGNTIFVLISGYFLVSKGPDINLKKTTVKLLSQQLYAAVVLTVFSTLVWPYFEEFFIRLVGFKIFNDMCWFIGYYYVIVLLAFLFLNKLLNNFNQKQYTVFLLAVFAFCQFYFSRSLVRDLSSGLTKLCIGIFLYAFGGYIRRYDPFEKIKAYVWVIVLLLANGLVLLSAYNSIINTIRKYNFSEQLEPFHFSITTYSDFSFLCIVIGLAIFEIFRRVDIGKSTVINFIGSSTLMVYLLHDNSFVHSIWNSVDWITPLNLNGWGFLGELVLCTLGTFAVCFAFYCVFAILEKLVKYAFSKKLALQPPTDPVS